MLVDSCALHERLSQFRLQERALKYHSPFFSRSSDAESLDSGYPRCPIDESSSYIAPLCFDLSINGALGKSLSNIVGANVEK